MKLNESFNHHDHESEKRFFFLLFETFVRRNEYERGVSRISLNESSDRAQAYRFETHMYIYTRYSHCKIGKTY